MCKYENVQMTDAVIITIHKEFFRLSLFFGDQRQHNYRLPLRRTRVRSGNY